MRCSISSRGGETNSVVAALKANREVFDLVYDPKALRSWRMSS